MPRISPWADITPIPEPTRESKSFTCPRTGYVLDLTLEVPDELGVGRANDLYEGYVARFLPEGKPPQKLPLPVVPAMAVPLSRHLLRGIALLQAMDVEPGPDPWGLAEWVGLALKYPEVWREASGWANRLGVTNAPNDSGAVTETLSEPPSALSTPTPSE